MAIKLNEYLWGCFGFDFRYRVRKQARRALSLNDANNK